jgi:hypothetical protein
MWKQSHYEHEDQVRRYLSTSVLSHSLAAGYSKVQEVERLWETGLFSITGELVYFLPDRLPVVHEITLTQDELKSVFTEQIVSNFNSARLQATLRAASNLAITHVIQIMKNIEGVVRPAEASGTFEFGNELVEKNTPTIASIVMEYYDPKFKDVSTKCIEIVGHNGKNEVLEMHVDKLLLAIQSKDIEADLGFNVHTGGKICCPVHGEHTPSLSVAFDLGKFRCFGCGIAGHFNLASIPENIEISMGRTVRYELDKLVIPPRHKEVMSLAQDILHQSFRRSAGEVYVATERGLDPDVSYHFMDIGYGDDRLIELLLVAGCTYDELLHYGLLGLSSGKNAHMGSVVQLLKRFNMTIDTQRRMMDDERTAGLPYSILGGRITYPLEIHNCINSIYGRSIDPLCPKPLKHRKTKAKYTGMRHGGLNISLATKSNAPYIMVSEAPLNMATLIQTSDLPAQTAIVGVNNPLLVELLSGYTGSLILGMDYDKPKWSEKLKRNIGETGQRNTILFRDKVVNDYGFKGRVLDFTGAFVKNNPGIIYNDPNQYWLDYGKRISILNNLQEIPETYTHSMEDK